MLDSKGFNVAIKAVPSAAPRNQVVEQDPIPTDRGGGKAEEGSTVTLSVSSGPAIVAVPVVANLSQADATKRLENAGFKVNVMQQYSKSVPRGLVIGTSPPAGTQLSTAQAVNLLVSRGANTVEVPNVVGLDDQAALAALSNAGLSGTEVQRDSTEPQGKVLNQSPGAGKRVARGVAGDDLRLDRRDHRPGRHRPAEEGGGHSSEEGGLHAGDHRSDDDRSHPGRRGHLGVPAGRVPRPARGHGDHLGRRRRAHHHHDSMRRPRTRVESGGAAL